MAPDSIWEIVFLMVILKIPVVYLCSVIWYAIKAQPRRGYGAGSGSQTGPDDPGPGWRRRRRTGPRRPPRPHGGPTRVHVRSPRTAVARAGRVGRR